MPVGLLSVLVKNLGLPVAGGNGGSRRECSHGVGAGPGASYGVRPCSLLVENLSQGLTKMGMVQAGTEDKGGFEPP